jgi:hypothetical protein
MLMRMLGVKFLIIMLMLVSINSTSLGDSETALQEKQQYELDYNLLAAVKDSITHSDVRDLDAYERFADGIVQKWRARAREFYGRLIDAICEPLLSGKFYGDRQYVLARNYALSALEEPDSISLGLEFELTGDLRILAYGLEAPTGDDFAQKRAEDTALRLHAWRRLLEAIDPDWDPNDMPKGNIAPPAATGLPAGIAAEAIQDTILRAEYERAIRANAEKARKYLEQYDYRFWLKVIPSRENMIIAQYSRPPFATEQLRRMLEDQIPDQEAKGRILKAVEKNIRDWQKEKHQD